MDEIGLALTSGCLPSAGGLSLATSSVTPSLCLWPASPRPTEAESNLDTHFFLILFIMVVCYLNESVSIGVGPWFAAFVPSGLWGPWQ